MTRDDLAKLYEQANGWSPAAYLNTMEELARFANLVAAHTLSNINPSSFMSYQEGFEAGAAAEREACARVCDEMEEKAEDTECCKWPTPIDCAAAIRARGETK